MSFSLQYHISTLCIVMVQSGEDPMILPLQGVGNNLHESQQDLLSRITAPHMGFCVPKEMRQVIFSTLCHMKQRDLIEFVARIKDTPGFSANLHSFSTTF